jgi:hypothetical protein
MFIRTTININIIMLKKISQAAILTGTPKNCIISSLLRRFADDYKKYEKSWTRVRYQDRDIKENWHNLHITLRPDEYEFYFDLRKNFKLSVSHCIAIAVKQYLDEIIHKIINGGDNYRYKNYTMARILINGVICWIQYWDAPNTYFSNYYKNKSIFVT